MTESMLHLRVSKINGAPPTPPKCVRSLRAFVRPGNRHYSKYNCTGTQSLECIKIFKFFFNAIGKQSIIIKLLDQGPNVVEIASLSIPLSWIPREHYVTESFPLRPLIPGIASPIAFVEIQLSSNENIHPFTLPPADLIHIPAWRPYPKVSLPEKPSPPLDNASAQQNNKADLLIDFDQSTDQKPVPNRFANDYTPQASINIKLKRKRSSSLCLDNPSKLEELVSENSSSNSDSEYTEESTSVEPAAEYKIYRAFAPPIMRNGMEPAKLEPKKYSDAELTEIISKHAYSGALLNGQYINPPQSFTKNTPLCDKVKSEKDKEKPNNDNNSNNNQKTNNELQIHIDDKAEHRHRHRHRHYHHHHHDNNNNNQSSRQRASSRSNKSLNPPNFKKAESNKLDQRSNSIQFGGKNFFQKSRFQKFIDIKNSIRTTPPPDYQELQNDVLFKDDA